MKKLGICLIRHSEIFRCTLHMNPNRFLKSLSFWRYISFNSYNSCALCIMELLYLQVKDDPRNGLYVENLSEEYVTSYEDVMQILIKVKKKISFLFIFNEFVCSLGTLKTIHFPFRSCFWHASSTILWPFCRGFLPEKLGQQPWIPRALGHTLSLLVLLSLGARYC